MDQLTPEMETELVDLSGQTLSSLGALGGPEFAGLTGQLLTCVDHPPTLSNAAEQSENSC